MTIDEINLVIKANFVATVLKNESIGQKSIGSWLSLTEDAYPSRYQVYDYGSLFETQDERAHYYMLLYGDFELFVKFAFVGFEFQQLLPYRKDAT